MNRCKICELTDVPSNEFLPSMNICISCWGIMNKQAGNTHRELDQVNHQFLLNHGYIFDKNYGYMKEREE